tara:strand:- start:10567 stop:11055 length:489 start_codon:yes stop_codon:yes gene_type:complete
VTKIANEFWEACTNLTGESLSECQAANFLGGGILAALIALGIITALLLLIALYIYSSYTWMTIAKKLKYKKAWLAWIPIINIIMMLQLGGFHWAWFFLILIPILGWVALAVLVIISTWRIFEKRKYPGWFSLSMIIPEIGGILYLIIIGFVAFKDRKKMLFN